MASLAVRIGHACAAIGVVVACATRSRLLAAQNPKPASQNPKPASTTPSGELKPGPGSPLTSFDTTIFVRIRQIVENLKTQVGAGKPTQAVLDEVTRLK